MEHHKSIDSVLPAENSIKNRMKFELIKSYVLHLAKHRKVDWLQSSNLQIRHSWVLVELVQRKAWLDHQTTHLR